MAALPLVDDCIGLLQKCRKHRKLEYAKRVHAHICNNGLECDRAVGNYIVPMFVECGSVSDAQQVFNTLVHRNVHSWTSLILGYIECGQSHHALKLYQEMQDDRVPPNSYTLMALVKACARLKDVDRGREIHVDIAHKGFERNVFVGSALVDMYIKCGSVLEAQYVFDKMPLRNVVSWNALIAGYAEHGPGLEALRCFEQMQMEGVSPDAVTFVCVLKACGCIGAIEKGREIHMEITQQGFEHEAFIGNTLVDMYARCGLLVEAREVFNNLPIRDVVSWTTLIAGYVEFGSAEEALKCFKWMQLEGVSPDSVTYVCALKVCGSTGAIDKGRELHWDIAQKGFQREVTVGNTLVDMYAKCGSLGEAREVLGNLPVRDVVSWNALIAGYAEHGPGQEALKCFEQMHLEGLSPNSVTYVSVLKACSSIGAIYKGREMHTEIAQKGFDTHDFVASTLIDMYIKCGSLVEAQEVFDKLPVRTVESWNALLAGHAEHGSGEEVLKHFVHLQLEGVTPDSFTFVCALRVCGSIGAMDKCREMHSDVVQRGFEKDVFVGSTSVDMYAKCGLLTDAQAIFDKLQVHNIVSWTALIAGYVEHGSCHEALKIFEQMQLEGLSADAVTFVCILKACGRVGAIDMGREMHADIAQKGFESDGFVSSTLIDMYAKCGSLAEAREVFDKLPVRGVMSWSAMIQGYGLNHEGDMAVKCFEDMQEQGVKPDDITFICLLTACSRAKLVLKGQEFFNVMEEDYGISPTVDHYTCMVELLAKSGHLYEAERFLETMPCSPVWTTLLSACKLYGEVELGLKCFQQLVQMDPEYAAPYVLMGKIYATAGRWDDAYKIECLRKSVGATKKPASAFIEVNKKVHEFVVGKQNKEISTMLEILSSRAKEEGHVPGVNLILRPISDEEKGAELCEHAEKLAIAFGLLNTPHGQTLRVTKNMRMCYDCHNTIKIISRIERREIIVRDTCDIHHFVDGSCSCGDIC